MKSRLITHTHICIQVSLRWSNEKVWPITRYAYFHMMPAPLRYVLFNGARRQLMRDMWGQGVDRYPTKEVEASTLEYVVHVFCTCFA